MDGIDTSSGKTSAGGFSGAQTAFEGHRRPGSASARTQGGRWRRLARGQRQDGQALVEFALVLPVLLLILLAILKLGLLFNNYLTLTDATRSGARYFALERGAATTPNNYCQLATTQVNNAASGLNTSKLTVTEAETSPDTCTSLTQGNSITVTSSYPCDFSFMGISFVPSCNLSVSASERVE